MGSDHRVTMDAIDVLGVAMRSIRQGNPGNAIDILADMQEQMRGIDWEADKQRIAKLETVLREMGKLAMEDAMSDKGFRHYVHTEAGFALEAEHEQD